MPGKMAMAGFHLLRCDRLAMIIAISFSKNLAGDWVSSCFRLSLSSAGLRGNQHDLQRDFCDLSYSDWSQQID